MLKKLLLLSALTLVVSTPVMAASYTFEVNFSNIKIGNLDFDFLVDTPFTYQNPRQVIFDIDLNGEIAQSGAVSVVQSGNEGLPVENWLITDYDEVLGVFSESEELTSSTSWALNTWDLDLTVLERINLSGILPVIFWEATDGFDIVAVDKIVLNIETAIEPPHPVPEPASLFLLGTGLLGATGMRKFAFTRAKK